jgi:ABC-2 type transport system ATP-binding protein
MDSAPEPATAAGGGGANVSNAGDASSEDLLVAVDLVKRYADVTAVDGASFTIRRGEIFGLLGPNGAGKTTTINLLTGLARPTSGRRLLDGAEYGGRLREAQARMGIVPDESNLYEDLDGFGNLCFCAALYGIGKRERERRARALLAEFGLEQAARRPFKAYSKGMKRKLTIAAGIIHDPEILFLDEPTTGIDVASARQIRQLVRELNRRGTTILLTTHYIEEAERLCNRIAFIVSGRIVRIGSLGELMREHRGGTVLELAVDAGGREHAEAVRQRFPDCTVEHADERSFRLVSDGAIGLLPLLSFLDERGGTVTEARMVKPTLEEVFVRITGIESGAMRQEREGRKG